MPVDRPVHPKAKAEAAFFTGTPLCKRLAAVAEDAARTRLAEEAERAEFEATIESRRIDAAVSHICKGFSNRAILCARAEKGICERFEKDIADAGLSGNLRGALTYGSWDVVIERSVAWAKENGILYEVDAPKEAGGTSTLTFKWGVEAADKGPKRPSDPGATIAINVTLCAVEDDGNLPEGA